MIGGATTSSGVSTTWAYYADTLRPFTQTSSGLTSGPAVDQTFKYYPNGMLSERTTSGVKETFEYDGTHRLGRYRREGSVVDATFRYNGAGHMTTVDMAASTSSDWPLADETMTYGAAETLNTDFLGSLTVGTGTRRFYNHDAGEGRLFEEKEESGSTIVVKRPTTGPRSTCRMSSGTPARAERSSSSTTPAARGYARPAAPATTSPT